MNEQPQQTVRAVVHEIREQLANAGIAAADTDAELLVSHVLGEPRGRTRVLMALDAPMPVSTVARARALADERAQRIPLQHLTGRAPFRNIELAVGPGVFTPRPETEVTVELALEHLRNVNRSAPIVLDLCTGSAAIALAIADEVPDARVWAIEKSVEAHAWAQRNVLELGDGRVQLLLGDATDAALLVPTEIVGRVEVVVSNPPYVPVAMVPREPEVRDHDPELALYSGSDGLDLIRVISSVARQLISPGGRLVVEHGEEQGAEIRRIFTAAGWANATTHTDLTERDRVTTAEHSAAGVSE